MDSIQAVIDQLILEGHLAEDIEDEIEEVLAVPEKSTPWFIQLMTGVGAWFTSMFFLAFILGSLLIASEYGAIFWGLVLIGAALFIDRQFQDSLFAQQIALVTSIVGIILFVGGIGIISESLPFTTIVLIVVEIIMIIFFDSSIRRFLSTLVIIGAIVTLIYDGEFWFGISILSLIVMGLTIFMWKKPHSLDYWQKWEAVHNPIAYALPIGLFALLLLPLSDEFGNVDGRLITIGFSILAFILALQIVKYYAPESSQQILPVLAMGIVLISIPTLPTPGILGAVIILMLGFWNHNYLLMGISVIFLGLFIIIFYYNLDTTLLNKSYLLLATGFIAFGLRWLLKTTSYLTPNDKKVGI